MQWTASDMDVMLKFTVFLCVVLNCNGASLRKQLASIARRQENGNGRRFRMHEDSMILGAPSYPRHLPEAEPILPGHTLIRPSIGMLKSAVKFPHKELDNGAGVYGNINNLGLTYDSRNERLMYSGFRRTPTDLLMSSEEELPEVGESTKDRYSVYNVQPKYSSPVKRFIMIFPLKFKNVPAKHNHDQSLIMQQPTNKKLKEKTIIESNIALDGQRSKKRQWFSYNKQYGKPKKAKRSLQQRLHSSVQSLLFTKKLLQKIRGTTKRRQQDIVILKPLSSVNNDYSYFDQSFETDPQPPEKPHGDKLNFLHGKDAFNHIKINADAPDLEDYLPANFADGNTHDLKNWWYYHEYDFVPFEEHAIVRKHQMKNINT